MATSNNSTPRKAGIEISKRVAGLEAEVRFEVIILMM